MTKKREGYRNLTIQLPEAICEAIEGLAAQQRTSFTEILTEFARQKLKMPPSVIPPKKRPGAKRKK